MVRISAIFIAACMVLIAASIGVVVYLRFGFTGAESALVTLGVLTALAVYNTIAARKHDRQEASNQIAALARGSGDLARQLAEFGRRLNATEGKVDTVIDRALATAQPLAAEIEELSTLVKQIAELGGGARGGAGCRADGAGPNCRPAACGGERHWRRRTGVDVSSGGARGSGRGCCAAGRRSRAENRGLRGA